ncbi:hypothetical protein VitviT2T_009898 [Vitis vinifera]|uniref:Uncharacterized protein n=1 Tax=Vitis vinifera TaxID=29760 RepID=A0ABY9C7Q5_VITVI|nr:hypothetical protein VitviT2T_009898 [Vitis vinifera]
MTFVYSWPSSWLSSIILEVDASVMEGLVCTYMGNRVASLTGSEAAILARASARFAKRFYRKNPDFLSKYPFFPCHFQMVKCPSHDSISLA